MGLGKLGRLSNQESGGLVVLCSPVLCSAVGSRGLRSLIPGAPSRRSWTQRGREWRGDSSRVEASRVRKSVAADGSLSPDLCRAGVCGLALAKRPDWRLGGRWVLAVKAKCRSRHLSDPGAAVRGGGNSNWYGLVQIRKLLECQIAATAPVCPGDPLGGLLIGSWSYAL